MRLKTRTCRSGGSVMTMMMIMITMMMMGQSVGGNEWIQRSRATSAYRHRVPIDEMKEV